jgi:hypothetical protein
LGPFYQAIIFFAVVSIAIMLVFVFIVQRQYAHKERRHQRARSAKAKDKRGGRKSKRRELGERWGSVGSMQSCPEIEEPMEDFIAPWSFDHFVELGLLRLIQASRFNGSKCFITAPDPFTPYNIHLLFTVLLSTLESLILPLPLILSFPHCRLS